jgi:hypothetical protein
VVSRLATVTMLVLALGTLASCVASCSSGGTDRASQRQLDAVMVGSDRELPTADADLVEIVGLELSTLSVPLDAWWQGLNDPATPTSAWLVTALALLEQMQAIVDRVESRVLSAETTPVRDTFVAYVAQWRTALRALDAVRGATERGDPAVQQKATDEYNAALGRIRGLDQARVDRVVAVYGRDDARRLLASEGLDPSRFGL